MLGIVVVDYLKSPIDRLLTLVGRDQFILEIWVLHFSPADVLSYLTISLCFIRLGFRCVEKR